ncbi:MAG: cytochrome C oxidase subunit II, partial [Comamonadaceae bacterium]
MNEPGLQSALHAAGPVAQSIAGVTQTLVIGGSAIFLLVMGLLALSLRRQR